MKKKKYEKRVNNWSPFLKPNLILTNETEVIRENQKWSKSQDSLGEICWGECVGIWGIRFLPAMASQHDNGICGNNEVDVSQFEKRLQRESNA